MLSALICDMLYDEALMLLCMKSPPMSHIFRDFA